jgi:3-oxoacyl-[acyl-carrier protein] reductase
VKLVLVTGGGSGLGKAVAARFRAGDDTVIITGRNTCQLASTAAEIGVRPVACDGTDPQQVTRMADELGTDLDVVVNMAGGNTDFTKSSGQRADLGHVMMAWRENLDANLLSSAHHHGRPGQAAGGRLHHQCQFHWRRTCHHLLRRGESGLAAWTAGLSSEVGSRGLTANVIAPGFIAGTNFFHGTLTGQRRTALIDATHNRRAGQPSDIAQTAYFLASDGARHITGQTLHVNGGAHTTR